MHYFLFVSHFVTQALSLFASSLAGREIIASVQPKAQLMSKIQITRAALEDLTGSPVDNDELREIILAAYTR